MRLKRWKGHAKVYDLQHIRDNAMSFTGLRPPNNAKYIGQVKTSNNIFYYYKDDKGSFWFDTESGREFEKKMQAAQRFKKSYKKSWSN